MGVVLERGTLVAALALVGIWACSPCAGEGPEPVGPWQEQDWPKGRTLTWAHPGRGGSFTDPANWLEDGQPAEQIPDRTTDVVLPAAEQFYRVNRAANQKVRHAAIGRNAMLIGGHRRELEVWGNCWVKPGGRIYYLSIRGPRHTFFRIDDAEYPNPSNGLRYGHTGQGGRDPRNRTQISHKFQICKYGDASVEMIGRFGVSDEIMLQHGRLILNGELRWSGQTNKGALEIYDGAVLELQSGAVAGPFVGRNGKSVYNLDVYRNGALQAGAPERPLTSDARLLLGFERNDRPGRSGLYAAAGSQIRVYSSEPSRARLVISAITAPENRHDGRGRLVSRPSKRAEGDTGVALQLAGDVQLDGAHFDYICREGIRLPDGRMPASWKHVTFGPHCAGEADVLLGALTADPNVYYHGRNDSQSEFGLTVKAVKSMEQFLAEADPYKIAVSPRPERPAPRRAKLPRPQAVIFTEPVEVKITCRISAAELRYTLDGTEPTKTSPLYEKPIRIVESTRLAVKAFAPDRDPSATFKAAYIFEDAAKRADR